MSDNQSKEAPRAGTLSAGGQAPQSTELSEPAQEQHTMASGAMQTTPGAWYYEGKWRELASYDEEEASWLRKTLASTTRQFVPTRQLTLEPHDSYQVANFRAALHDIVDELSHEDLYTLYRVGHLLFTTDNAGEGWRMSRAWAAVYRFADQGAAGLHQLAALLDAEETADALDQAEELLLQAWEGVSS